MEVIKKVISLEQFKSRFNHKTPYINYDGTITPVAENKINNWGEIVCDYKFNDLEKECTFAKIKDKLPLIECIDVIFSNGETIPDSNEIGIIKTYCFRYKTMVYWYNWINNYGKNCEYYKLCKRGWVRLNEYKEEIDFFDNKYGSGLTNITSLESKPETTKPYELGKIIEVNRNAKIFNEKFRIDNDETRYELLVLNFIKNFFENKIATNDVTTEGGSADDETIEYKPIDIVNLSTPYIKIPIHLSQTIDSLGILKSTAKEWEPRKTYMIGDIVIYNGDTYILSSGNTIGFTEITSATEWSMYDIFFNHMKNEYEDDDVVNETEEEDVPYIYEYMGYNFIKLNNKDELNNKFEEHKFTSGILKNIFYLDNPDILYLPYISHKAMFDNEKYEYVFNTDYWKVNKGGGDDISGQTYNAVVESRLASVRRYKKSVDDDGIILPFIFDEKKSMDTEIPFNAGFFNIYLSTNDVIRADVMKEINIYNDEEDKISFLLSEDGNTIITAQTICETFDNTINTEISLNNDIKLSSLTSNTIDYVWKEVGKSLKQDYKIELIDKLPTPDETNLGKTYQTSGLTSGATYYYTHKCAGRFNVVYGTTSKEKVMIKPSMLFFGSGGLKESGYIRFDYIKDSFLNYGQDGELLIDYKNHKGVEYIETYKYFNSVSFINYISSEYIEKKCEHIYVLEDHEYGESEEISGKISEVDTTDMYNVGKIYEEVDENGWVTYKRLLSKYNFIDIDFDDNLYEVNTGNENNVRTIKLSTATVELNNIENDDFQKDYTIKDEKTIGIENISEKIDINIERGVSSAFEKHHILAEIKSLSDLENYRNNLFKI